MVTEELIVAGLTLGCIYALVGLGFHLVYRMSGLLDFAQGEKLVVGSLVALTLVRSGTAVLAALGIVAVGGLVAGVVYDRLVIVPTARNGSVAAVASTVGASLLLTNAFQLIYGNDGQPFPSIVSGHVDPLGFPIQIQSLLTWAVVAAICLGLWAFLARSRVGQGIVAASTDALAARAVGISVGTARTITFSLSFGLAVVAGILVAPITLAGGGLGTTLTLDGFAGAVIGGLNSTVGAVVGSIALGVVQSVVGGWLPNGYEDVVVYGLLLLSLVVMPTGIFGIRGGRLA